MNGKGLRRALGAGGFVVALVALSASGAGRLYAQSGAILFQEGFEDTGFGARGWYDGSGAALSTAQAYAGARSFECRFPAGATDCAGGTPRRHLFTAGDSVYVSFYIKHSSNWVGSGRTYHPHMFQLVTNLDSAYVGPAYTHLTAYIEAIGGVPHLGIQDGRNIDNAQIGRDLTGVTEQRGVAGCNGDSDGYGTGECYPNGAVHWNGKMWTPGGQVFFDNTAGSSRYKGDWHLVEAYFRLNTIVNGKGIRDGVLRYWYDGSLVLDRSDVVLRTGANATMKFNQFLLAPFIGDGSPVDQSFWIDNLLVATDRPALPPVPPGTGSAAPTAPSNLRIVP